MNFLRSFSIKYHTLLTFVVAIITPLFPLALIISMPTIQGTIHPTLLFFPTIILSAWYGGIQRGIVTTVISTSALFYFAIVTIELPITFFIEKAIFFIEGILISFAIEYYKNTNKETIYRQKERMYKTLVERLEKQREKNVAQVKARDEFLSIASHELRTPLTSMLLQLQSALYNIRNVSLANFSVPNLLSMLENVEQQSKQLSRMINDLLNVSLITTGRLNLELEETDLVQLAQSIASRFSEEFKKENIQFEFTSDESLKIVCDKLRIEQVLSNLITNAIKYGNKKPIELTVTRQNNHALIRVKDQGVGIPKEKQKVIFARFERAVSTHDINGLGIGLYITQQIVNAHHGSIEVHSKPNSGSTFTIKLPIKGPQQNGKVQELINEEKKT